MDLAKQTFTLLRRRPILWLPQLIVAVINLLLNTASSGLARHIGRAVRSGRIPGITEHYTLRTPDALVASDGATLPLIYTSFFIQHFLILAAVVSVAVMIRRPKAGALGGELTARRSAILNTALLITGLLLLNVTSDVILAAGFSYIPALRPSPAWLLIVLDGASFLAVVIAFYWIAVPWVLRLAAPDMHTPLTRRQVNTARWVAAIARILWDLFSYGWGRLEGLFLPPRVDPGPFWHAPITLGGPVFLWILLTSLSVAAALIAQRRSTRA